MQYITLLGSTGSIGKSTLAVMAQNPSQFKILALVAHHNWAEMAQQCLRFRPRFAALLNADAALQLQQQLKSNACPTEVLTGQAAINQLAALPEADQVVAAIVGVAGLLPTLAAIQAGKRVLLANKESLVTCGRLFMQAVQHSGAQLLPLDSEHNAIFQCLPVAVQQSLGTTPLERYGIHQLILTGSGGPLRQLPLAELAQVTPEQACRHPNWSMGRKISVDSATMMNKGLEYIEARWLFNATAQQLAIVVHPQSLIHAMVTFIDGSVLTQCGQPDMRTAIGYALAYPQRIATGVAPLDFSQIAALTFEPPDSVRYPCLALAIAACHAGQVATTVLNAANEVAVEAFLQQQLCFTDIVKVNEQVLSMVTASEPNSIEAVLAIDQQARQAAYRCIKNR